MSEEYGATANGIRRGEVDQRTADGISAGQGSNAGTDMTIG